MKTVVYLRSPRKILEQQPQLEIPIYPQPIPTASGSTIRLADLFSLQNDPPARKTSRILNNEDAGYVDRGPGVLAL